MKNKLTKILLTITMMIVVLPILKTSLIVANAKTTYGYYPIGCSAYEVDTITNSGTFAKVSCHTSLAEAKTAMKNTGTDAVVRHAGSYSANQIIAMTNGFVFSYGYRNSSSTVTISGYGNTAGASTYVQNYRGLYYEDTLDYNGSGDGNVLVNAFGFEGLVSMEMVDFIPMKFFELDAPIWVGGNPDTPWQVIPNSTYYTVERNGNYLDLVLHGYNDYPSNGNGTHAESYTGSLAVGPAASWMQEGSYYYTLDDATFYSDHNFKNYAGTYYNYYLFAPLRTKSNISADKYNAFLQAQGYDSSSKLWDTGSIFLNGQSEYGINAAAVFAQACVEAAYGTSYYATRYNNLFGVGAYDDGPSVNGYETVNRSINNQMGLLLRYYTDTDCAWYYGGTLGNKGAGITTKYASAVTYGLTLASLYYRFDKFASGNDGNLVDCNSSTIGVLHDQVTNVYTDSNGSSVLYQYRYGYNTDYVKNQTVVILGEAGEYYKIQSTDYVANGTEMHPANSKYVTYDWNGMVGYVKKSDVVSVIGDVSHIQTRGDVYVDYQTHVQDQGWQSYVFDGQMSGTQGKALRLEAIKIKVGGNVSGGIEYRTHVENIGWQDWKSSDELSGTTGMGYRLEGIQIKLTGDLASQYDVYYQVHAEYEGWLGWAKNGEAAGTEGLGYRLEAIKIVLVKKGDSAPGSTDTPFVSKYSNGLVRYTTHVQDVGWQSYVNDGSLSGTVGRALRLEGIKISLSPNVSGGIEYCTHVQDVGWQNYVSNDAMSGTSGRGLRLEAIQIRLTGQAAEQYDIYYQVHAEDVGWMGWAKNGEQAGTAGYGRRLEGIKIVLVAKGGAAPGSTENCFLKK